MTAAIDHLADHPGSSAETSHLELLRGLTDTELAEQMAWYRSQRDKLREGYVRHGFNTLLSTAYIVQNERQENDTP